MYTQSQETKIGNYLVTQYSDEVGSILLRNAVVISGNGRTYPPKSIGHWCLPDELLEIAEILIQEFESQTC